MDDGDATESHDYPDEASSITVITARGADDYGDKTTDYPIRHVSNHDVIGDYTRQAPLNTSLSADKVEVSGVSARGRMSPLL